MIDSKSRLTLLQSILRGLFTVVGFGLLGLPFLEILVHPWRRGFHDKMSDTILVNAKKRIKNDIPHKPYLEVQLVKYYLSWSLGSIMLFMLLALIISQIETIPTNGRRPASITEKQNVTSGAQSLQCGEKDFTEVMNLWRTEKLSQECLLSSADKLLWSKKSSVLNRQKAYAIKGILESDDGKALQYLMHSQRPTEKIKDKENVSPNAHRL
jgi:hypothetical protein